MRVRICSRPFPELERALSGSYLETRGEIAEAAGVRGRKDAQWLAAHPVSAAGQLKGLYVTGWSFSAYAYRLENQLRSQIRSSLEAQDKQPLVYVFVVVGRARLRRADHARCECPRDSRPGLLQETGVERADQGRARAHRARLRRGLPGDAGAREERRRCGPSQRDLNAAFRTWRQRARSCPAPRSPSSICGPVWGARR